MHTLILFRVRVLPLELVLMVTSVKSQSRSTLEQM